jgi:hypothetical protein
MEKLIQSAFACLAAVFLASCGDGGYNTEFAPPAGDEKYGDIFPKEVGGVAAKIEPLSLDAARYEGAIASYGTGARVVIVQTKDEAALDEYVKGTAVPKLESYGSRSSGKMNGVWKFRGSGDKGRLYGWQNGSWVFAVEASNDTLFDEAVSKFPYISKK